MKFEIETYEDKQQKNENQRIEQIEKCTQNFIYLRYSQEKQLNVSNGLYDDEYKKEMITFINKCKEINKQSINNGISIEEHNNILAKL